ncbi:MAG: hypothetical protein JXA11_14765 [Phycisphaerae bacterium]|nr:hypothetical protein [Phycisphaerae bacterium]
MMGIGKEYFRRHPWQKRVIGVILVVIIGAIVGRLTYPWYLWYQRRQADLRLIEQLGAADSLRRERAVQTAIALGRQRDELVHRLAGALDTPDDGRFLSLRFVLQRLGKYDVTNHDPKWDDRYRLLEFRATFAPGEKDTPPSAQDDATPTARMRRWIVKQALLCERNNPYIHQTLTAAVEDPAAIVRSAAAPLAARLGDDVILQTLLHDPAAEVRAVATLDAGLARRTMLARPIRRQLESWLDLPGPHQPADIDQAASAAYALALLDPTGNSEFLCRAAVETNVPELRDRLLLTLAILKNDAARQAVMDILHTQRWKGKHPDGITLIVAGQLKLPEAAAMAKDVLRAAAERKEPVPVSRVLAALDVVAAAGYPCRATVYALCRELWAPDQPALRIRSANLLGVQAGEENQVGDAPSREACVKTLQQAVQFSRLAEGQDKPVTTPLPSAAAAVALWRLEPSVREFALLDGSTQPAGREDILKIVESKTSLFYLREATAVEDPAAGDYVAWHVAQSGLPEAVVVGNVFLPAGEGNHPEYNPDVRACGAMILALSAKDEQQRRAAIERIQTRLAREEYPASGSLKCALLTAGDKEQLATVRMLLELEDFPAARALMALLAAGDKTALDWLLWNTNWNLPVPLEDIPPLLIDQVIGDVLKTVSPSLPEISPAGSEATRLWQARILRHTYGIHRASLHVGLKR